MMFPLFASGSNNERDIYAMATTPWKVGNHWTVVIIQFNKEIKCLVSLNVTVLCLSLSLRDAEWTKLIIIIP